jgi:hypothetical protein
VDSMFLPSNVVPFSISRRMKVDKMRLVYCVVFAESLANSPHV